HTGLDVIAPVDNLTARGDLPMPHSRRKHTAARNGCCPCANPQRKSAKPVRFLFVGERPSPRAEQIGATLGNGKLSGKTLWDALLALNLDPSAHHYLNLYRHSRPVEDILCEEAACLEILRLIEQGYIVVGLGCLVSERLYENGIPHLRMIHPAAR